MSQKVRIDGVKHAGASVFLGVDHCGNPCWTRDPERVMVWLCDGWRSRFNQRREQRPRSTPVKDDATWDKTCPALQGGGGRGPRLQDAWS